MVSGGRGGLFTRCRFFSNFDFLRDVQPLTVTQPKLLSRITCPHCWHRFPPADTLWVASHPSLYGDARLGPEAQRRFLPTRFAPNGNAIDSQGSVCSDVACPKCHLVIPRPMFEMPCLFYSILGSPGSGKSHLLATTTWRLRRTLGHRFRLSMSDADPESNATLNDAEATLFFSDAPNTPAAIAKTEKEGRLYQPVQFGDETVWYPRPFVFSLQPLDDHPLVDESASRAMCLYDNAGEHFLPGGESSISPATQHLTVSRGLLFLFDPTQHAGFREACHDSPDPQFAVVGRSHRQDQILQEAAKRIRTHGGLSQREKYGRPLIVVVTKLDAWAPCVWPEGESLADPVRETSELHGLDRDSVEAVSDSLREVMCEYAPEFVNAAEGFASKVRYIPVSALGRPPVQDPESGALRIRPRDVAPIWAEVPLLYLLGVTSSGLIPTLNRRSW